MRGLTSSQVKERLDHHQVNRSRHKTSKGYMQIVREHTLTYFNGLNLFLAFLIILSGKYLNMTFIGVVLSNMLIGIAQEFKVKQTIDRLKIVNTAHVQVIRDGQMRDIDPRDLVMDDLVFVASGTQIAADLEVVETSYCEMNESLLTGESDPVKKQKGDELLAGTFVSAGQAYAKVMRVGDDVYATQLAHQARHGHRAASEMKDTIEKIIKVLSIIIIPVGLLLFRSQYFANNNISNAIVKTVAGVVGMIPEGLVLLTSLSFVLGVGRLARKRALVQQMEAIEALARVDVLCLDKTGTITTGDLKVEEVVPLNTSLEMVTAIMQSISHESDVQNATQNALKAYFTALADKHVTKAIPFSSERKYSGYELDGKQAYLLGAPEFLCHDPALLQRVTHYSANGLRVLMLGQVPSLTDPSEMTPLALIVMSDVIKEDCQETFAFFDKEDVSLRIISGDHPLTVERVCKQAGLKHPHAIDASSLPDDEEALAKMVEDYNVFGRVRPEQKEKLVHAFQKNGHVTAMVGDGVNDVLAIKESDCGIAMANGADAAKSAAHIVLLDSNFFSMVEIVKEGRTIIANIERVCSLYLTKTLYSTMLSIFFSISGKTYPFTPFQLSIISGFAIGYPSFFITLEKDVKVASKGFLNHVIKTALPCALAITTMVIFVTLGAHLLHLSHNVMLSYSYLITVFVSFIVLLKICLPFNAYRLFIFLLCASPVLFVINFLSHYLSILPLFNRAMLMVLPMLGVSLFIEEAYARMIHLCVKYHVVTYLKQWFKKCKKHVFS